jgi:hypothetical protein
MYVVPLPVDLTIRLDRSKSVVRKAMLPAQSGQVINVSCGIGRNLGAGDTGVRGIAILVHS